MVMGMGVGLDMGTGRGMGVGMGMGKLWCCCHDATVDDSGPVYVIVLSWVEPAEMSNHFKSCC